MTFTELKAAKLTAWSALGGAVVCGLASFAGAYLQGVAQEKLQIQKIKAESIELDRQVFMSKSEKLFSSLSDLISFFDANDRFERVRAKVLLSEARRSAWEFAVVTSPELAFKAFSAVEALNQGIDANDQTQLKAALADIALLAKDLTESFYRERAIFDERRANYVKP